MKQLMSNPAKELWLTAFSAARLVNSADIYTTGCSWQSRCPKALEKAIDYALTARDPLNIKPGRIFYLQAIRRRQDRSPNHPMSAWNCRCRAIPIIKTTGET